MWVTTVQWVLALKFICIYFEKSATPPLCIHMKWAHWKGWQFASLVGNPNILIIRYKELFSDNLIKWKYGLRLFFFFPRSNISVIDDRLLLMFVVWISCLTFFPLLKKTYLVSLRAHERKSNSIQYAPTIGVSWCCSMLRGREHEC